MKNTHPIFTLNFFKTHLWKEIARFNLKNKQLGTVTCTEENYLNLYNRQFGDKTAYDEVFYYKYSGYQDRAKWTE